jgi:hypothetical protein
VTVDNIYKKHDSEIKKELSVKFCMEDYPIGRQVNNMGYIILCFIGMQLTKMARKYSVYIYGFPDVPDACDFTYNKLEGNMILPKSMEEVF